VCSCQNRLLPTIKGHSQQINEVSLSIFDRAAVWLNQNCSPRAPIPLILLFFFFFLHGVVCVCVCVCASVVQLRRCEQTGCRTGIAKCTVLYHSCGRCCAQSWGSLPAVAVPSLPSCPRMHFFQFTKLRNIPPIHPRLLLEVWAEPGASVRPEGGAGQRFSHAFPLPASAPQMCCTSPRKM